MTFVGTVGVHPKNIKDGIVLLELPAGSRYGSYEITAEIEPDDIDRGFYVRGFFVSSDDCANFSINYPAEDKMKFKKKFF
jgi:hypothetical protein